MATAWPRQMHDRQERGPRGLSPTRTSRGGTRPAEPRAHSGRARAPRGRPASGRGGPRRHCQATPQARRRRMLCTFQAKVCMLHAACHGDDERALLYHTHTLHYTSTLPYHTLPYPITGHACSMLMMSVRSWMISTICASRYVRAASSCCRWSSARSSAACPRPPRRRQQRGAAGRDAHAAGARYRAPASAAQPGMVLSGPTTCCDRPTRRDDSALPSGVRARRSASSKQQQGG
jgi:hypothetical protein